MLLVCRMNECSGYEIVSGGIGIRQTVWVNGQDGMCLGRFSNFGIDVHKDTAGHTSCLDCKAGPVTPADWKRFQESMLRYHQIHVPDSYMPQFLKERDDAGLSK